MSFSVPTSPVMSRSTKTQPVTPQRLPRQQPRSHRTTGSSTLTTPDNVSIGVKKRLAFSAGSPDVIRNAAAVQDKSIADIAENWRSRANENGIKVSFAAQEDSNYVADDSSDMSLSDVANDSSIISTEEALLAPPFLSTHRRLNSLPTTSRPRAQSHASLPTSRIASLSPIASRTTDPNLMSTPPPNRTLARQLKLKGSLTDPAQPRRREAFGAVSATSHNIGHRNASMSLTLEPDTSLDLFDIDENEFEYENDCQASETENSFSRSLQALQTNSFGYPTFALRHQQGQSSAFDQPTFADPFQPHGATNGLLSGHVLNGIAESVEHHFQAVRQQQPQKLYYDDLQARHIFYAPVNRIQPQCNQGMPHAYPSAAFVPVPQPSLMPFQPPIPLPPKAVPERSFSSSCPTQYPPAFSPEPSPTDCSVCLASHPTTLAILQPCRHPLCSACLTSALNIVGEKDMECAVCKQNVADFKLIMGSSKGVKHLVLTSRYGLQAREKMVTNHSDLAGQSFMDPLFSASPGSSNAFDHENANDSGGDLESAFEFGLDFGELRASTPKLEQQSQEYSAEGSGLRKGEDNVVLRIDNVPWDITPVQIIKWLQQPVERVHVLLDSKGKTLSHAYVEVKEAATAGAILRGEALSSGSSGRKERGSVLGRGRRARGVTVTRSGQEELLSDLFPCWRGGFDGSRPSLAGVEGERIIGALEGGLLTENEISGLLYLIREPDSHFLKVPSLPFHSLISILTKLPTDVDSRVFWSANIRDRLFGNYCRFCTTDTPSPAAIQVLLPRISKVKEISKSLSGHQEEEYTIDLAIDLLHTALNCNAFTTHQIQRFAELAQACSLPLLENDLSRMSDSSDMSGSSALRTPSSQDSSIMVSSQRLLNRSQSQSETDGSLDELAKEFGIDAHVVQALAQRLAKLC
ncbi:hypothetical protein BDZ97DRAFT_1902071 [Flammula alnicola]|nr:hypothetical protein BDZ97DRAFT_1902071 [Flammula alnicola]